MSLFLVTRAIIPDYEHYVGRVFEVSQRLESDYDGNCWEIDYVIDSNFGLIADVWEDVEGKYVDSLKAEEKEMYTMLYPEIIWRDYARGKS